MLPLYSSTCCRASTAKAFRISPPFFFFAAGDRNPKFPFSVAITTRNRSGITGDLGSDGDQEPVNVKRTNYAGVRLEEIVDVQSGKLRLDSWISSRISGISRARVQSSIRAGLVLVNGRVIDKVTSVMSMKTLSEVFAMNLETFCFQLFMFLFGTTENYKFAEEAWSYAKSVCV